MEKHTFTFWLHMERIAARYALLALYEQRDRLQYIEGPRLEEEYMDKIGPYEETVIREEIECEILQKKQQMIQTMLNRREPIDEAAIDAELEKIRQQKLQEAAGPSAPQEFAELTLEQSDKLQEVYRSIVKNFHPQMYPDLTEVHRQLFQKAQEAYRRRDLTALELIQKMLYSIREEYLNPEAMIEHIVERNLDAEDGKWVPDGIGYGTDYTLVSQIYGAFKATAEEASIQEEWGKYRQTTESVMKEMEDMRNQFPYTASDMLSDPAKIEAYKEELEHRLYTAKVEKERRVEEIRTVLEGCERL